MGILWMGKLFLSNHSSSVLLADADPANHIPQELTDLPFNPNHSQSDRVCQQLAATVIINVPTITSFIPRPTCRQKRTIYKSTPEPSNILLNHFNFPAWSGCSSDSKNSSKWASRNMLMYYCANKDSLISNLRETTWAFISKANAHCNIDETVSN